MAFSGTERPAAKVAGHAFPLLLGPFVRLLFAPLALTPLPVIHRKRLASVQSRNLLEIAVIIGVGLVAFTLFVMTGMRRANDVIGVLMSLSPAAMVVLLVVPGVLIAHNQCLG